MNKNSKLNNFLSILSILTLIMYALYIFLVRGNNLPLFENKFFYPLIIWAGILGIVQFIRMKAWGIVLLAPVVMSLVLFGLVYFFMSHLFG